MSIDTLSWGMVTGCFFNLTAAELATLRTNYLACLNAIAVGAQSYAIGGRTFTRANLQEVKAILNEILVAQQKQAGTRITRVSPDFRNR